MSAPLRVLVVDDEENLRLLLDVILQRAGYRVVLAGNGKDALQRLGDADIVLCDIRMPEMDGLGFLAALPEGAPPVIMMSAYGTENAALEAIRKGAYDYVSKPFSADEIVLTLRKLEEREQLLRDRAALVVENEQLRRESTVTVQGFVGNSPAIHELLRVLGRAAAHDSTVLLTGESGTGKELLARALHRLSPRHGGPWVAVNCAAIPEALLESELFGHVRGAFTGAIRDHAGLFVQADGGTLFLDEIGDLPSALQAKLLRVLQESVVRPLGARADVPVDVRIVAATAQSLEPPAFREDLYYRLARVHLDIPPLRERRDDIPLLVEHLLEGLSRRMHLPRARVGEAAMRVIVAHAWPGNVRQLENTLERALLLCDGDELQLRHLPPAVRDAPVSGSGMTDPGDLSIPRAVSRLERDLIERALRESANNKAAASRKLEISYKALLYKIRDYGIGS